MTVDVNAYLGHWPFRPLHYNTADGLITLMDRNGIDRAVVSSIHGIFYKNSQTANEELIAEIAPHRDRLIPFATLNPMYVDWEEDLKRCRDLGMRGLRLFPVYHNYTLTDEESLHLIRQATEWGWPIAVPMRVVDIRQRHWMDVAEQVPMSDFEAVVRKCPETPFVFLNGIGFENSSFVKDESLKQARFMIEISRLTSVLTESIPKLLDALGPSKLVFGSGMPFKIPKPALLKIEILDADREVKERIYGGNAAELLGLQS
ncbi:MAG: amidohydrolase family protein [Candidatus Latescibacteria bacterium]|nr:amidohydrolase family protein [Candidatus Latescibacterota bacterium]